MEVAQDILLPVLVAAVVANTVLLLLIVVVTRRRGISPATTQSVLQGSLLSTSYMDRSDGPSLASEIEAMTDDAGFEAVTDDAASAADIETDALAEAGAPTADGGDAPAEPEAGGAIPGEAGDPDGVGMPVVPGDAGEHDATPGVDTLTGLMGPAAFRDLIALEDLRIRRYHRPATVVIFELGGLDRLVERLGTDAADRVVTALADTMRRLAREADVVARVAPGRFGALLPETDEVAAINYVERVRRACELWLESGAIALSLAVGWAGTTGDPTLPEAQRLATDRMYAELRRDARKAVEG